MPGSADLVPIRKNENNNNNTNNNNNNACYKGAVRPSKKSTNTTLRKSMVKILIFSIARSGRIF
jgi:hypothetical protein